MSERRQSAHRRVHLGGRAAFEKPNAIDECLVRDLSPGGARITFSGSTPIPDAFALTVHDSGETRAIRVVWRDGLEAGVAYQAGATGGMPQARRRIRRLEADRDALLRRLAECDRGT